MASIRSEVVDAWARAAGARAGFVADGATTWGSPPDGWPSAGSAADGPWTGTLGSEPVAVLREAGVVVGLVGGDVAAMRAALPSGMVLFRALIASGQATDDATRVADAMRGRASILDHVRSAVIATDLAGRVTYWNPEAQALYGWSAAEALGANIVDLTPQSGSREVADSILRALAESGSWEGEFPVQRRDGTSFVAHVVDAVIRDGEGRPVGVVGISADVTERETRRGEIEKVRRLEALGRLAGGLAHDFNNVLTAIAGNVYLARRLVGPEHPASSRLLDAEREGVRAGRLTRRLLTFAAGGEPRRERVSFGEVVERIVDALAATDEIAVPVTVAVGPDLPDVVGDEAQLSQLVHDLVAHAAASPGVTRVSVAASAAGSDVEVVVCDDGDGLGADALARLFDPYAVSVGTGFGLASAYSIARRHGGTLSATPVERGLRIALRLPGVPPTRERRRITQETTPRRPLRVLVMDDLESLRRIYSRVLTAAGHEVTATGDGAAALAEYRAALEAGRRYDVVVLDLVVPGGMGGREAMAAIRELDPDAVGIVASGYSSDAVAADPAAHGFRRSVAKPFGIEDLLRAIDEAAAT